MATELNAVEVRVLGSLVEKEATTPDAYPLTVNALVHACNQTSNRWPVVAYSELMVQEALHSLRELGLVRVVHSVHNRAIKYRHVADEEYAISRPQLALLGVLLLRGPQTAAELRARTERYCSFADGEAVEAELAFLAGTDPDPDGTPRRDPLVVRLARQPGQKEPRHAHLLAGPPDLSDLAPSGWAADGRPAPAGGGAPSSPARDRMAAVEEELADLRAELAQVRAEIDSLRHELGA
jgi:uncharacterized protein YceH (UPF0502 family)